MSRLIRTRASVTAAAALVVTLLVGATAAAAAVSQYFDFNSPGQLAGSFDSYISSSSGPVAQSLTGGLADSGAISALDEVGSQAVFTTKDTYSLGPVGSTYAFSAYMKSEGNSGYSGLGFSSLLPSATNSTGVGGIFRPTDALGISVHGGGFAFHNGAQDFWGNWGSEYPSYDPAITMVKGSATGDLLNSGSPTDKWYLVKLIITRASATTFDMHVEVWPSDASGSLLRDTADAVFELNDAENAALANAASIRSYLNFSGYRMTYVDEYRVDLAGGATIIPEGEDPPAPGDDGTTTPGDTDTPSTPGTTDPAGAAPQHGSSLARTGSGDAALLVPTALLAAGGLLLLLVPSLRARAARKRTT